MLVVLLAACGGGVPIQPHDTESTYLTPGAPFDFVDLWVGYARANGCAADQVALAAFRFRDDGHTCLRACIAQVDEVTLSGSGVLDGRPVTMTWFHDGPTSFLVTMEGDGEPATFAAARERLPMTP